MQGKKLTLVPNTADCFRATVRVLRSMDSSKGVAFHTYSLPEDLCTRFPFKGLVKNMPEQDIREELEILEIPVVGVTAPLASPLSRTCKGQVPLTTFYNDICSRAPFQ